MKTAFIFGQRSKMGENLTKNLDELKVISLEDFTQNGADYLFLTGTREKSFEFLQKHKLLANKIFDFSGSTKFEALKNHPEYAYALSENNKAKIISFPGCASWAIIHILSCIKDVLPSKIWASVNFPQSAIGRNSQNKESSFIHPFSHLQEKEINLFFKKENLIKISPSIVKNNTGLTFSLMFEGMPNVDYKKQLLQARNTEIVLCEKVDEVTPQEEKTYIHITQQGNDVCIIGATNNLVGKKYKTFL